MNNPLSNPPSSDEQRSKFNRINLRIVLVLTFIGSGYSIFNNLYMGLLLPTITKLYNSGTIIGPMAEMCKMFGIDVELLKNSFEMSIAVPRIFYFLAATLYTLSFIGALLMWHLKKIGFHFYSLAQLLILIATLLFLDKAQLGFGDIMFTLLFIGFYFITLRNLGVFTGTTNETTTPNNPSEEDNIKENTDFENTDSKE